MYCIRWTCVSLVLCLCCSIQGQDTQECIRLPDAEVLSYRFYTGLIASERMRDTHMLRKGIAELSHHWGRSKVSGWFPSHAVTWMNCCMSGLLSNSDKDVMRVVAQEIFDEIQRREKHNWSASSYSRELRSRL